LYGYLINPDVVGFQNSPYIWWRASTKIHIIPHMGHISPDIDIILIDLEGTIQQYVTSLLKDAGNVAHISKQWSGVVFEHRQSRALLLYNLSL